MREFSYCFECVKFGSFNRSLPYLLLSNAYIGFLTDTAALRDCYLFARNVNFCRNYVAKATSPHNLGAKATVLKNRRAKAKVFRSET